MMTAYEYDCIKTKQAFAVLVMDDYTNRIITGKDVTVLLEGERASLEKEEGYHIFFGLKNQVCHLSAGGWLFQQKDFLMDMEAKTPKTVRRIRLMPNRQYAAGMRAGIITGKAAPDTEISFFFPDSCRSPRLYQDAPAGADRILIYQEEECCLEGITFLMQSKENQREEVCIEETLAKEKEYLLADKLVNTYSKTETRMHRIYTVTADRTGDFFFLIPRQEAESRECSYYINGNREIICSRPIEAGSVNEWEEIENVCMCGGNA